MTIFVPARAKINLNLHLTGRREDGYHLVSGWFVFADCGDEIYCEEADDFSLSITGPFAASLTGTSDNSVVKAAQALATALGVPLRAKITLVKNLPVASGIGGGTADAAATLKALQKLWGKELPKERLDKLLLSLGADVPICYYSHSAVVEGIGEVIKKAPVLPVGVAAVLVNPLREVNTRQVFLTREKKYTPAFDFALKYETVVELAAALKQTGNDLKEAAVKIAPQIKEVLYELDSCTLFAQMSGSGATCFGLCENLSQAKETAAVIKQKKNKWWVKAAALI